MQRRVAADQAEAPPRRARRLLAVLTVALLAAAGCGDSDGGDFWGPLAVSAFAGGDQALISGTLRLTDGCAHLDEGDDRVLLVWPVDQTTWDGVRRRGIVGGRVRPAGRRVRRLGRMDRAA